MADEILAGFFRGPASRIREDVLPVLSFELQAAGQFILR
jgi:hypothetical protein